VDFWLSDEQRELQAAVRSLVHGRFDLAELAANEGTERVITRWDELAAMGIFSMRSDGLGVREAALAFEELGRGLVPGPLVATHVAAGLVDGAADGTAIVGLYEPGAEVTMVEHAAEASAARPFA
jgi:alkylation response protein AidB-like acyl-CoA dehydrogenase